MSSNSTPGAVAGAGANCMREGTEEVKMQMIAPRAANQVKGVAIERDYVAPSGMDLCLTPEFSTLLVEGGERTAVEFVVRARHSLHASVHVAQE